MGNLPGIILIFIFVINMVPATLSGDTAKIQEAAKLTSDHVSEYTADAISEKCISLPFESIFEELFK